MERIFNTYNSSEAALNLSEASSVGGSLNLIESGSIGDLLNLTEFTSDEIEGQ